MLATTKSASLLICCLIIACSNHEQTPEMESENTISQPANKIKEQPIVPSEINLSPSFDSISAKFNKKLEQYTVIEISTGEIKHAPKPVSSRRIHFQHKIVAARSSALEQLEYRNIKEANSVLDLWFSTVLSPIPEEPARSRFLKSPTLAFRAKNSVWILYGDCSDQDTFNSVSKSLKTQLPPQGKYFQCDCGGLCTILNETEAP